jgi:hypothetical protein
MSQIGGQTLDGPEAAGEGRQTSLPPRELPKYRFSTKFGILILKKMKSATFFSSVPPWVHFRLTLSST